MEPSARTDASITRSPDLVVVMPEAAAAVFLGGIFLETVLVICNSATDYT